MSHGRGRIQLKIASFISILLLLLTACSADVAGQERSRVPAAYPLPPGSPLNGLVQTSTGGGVTIDVEWLGLKDGLLVFGVTMDTHSGSVDQYDLRELATLRDGSGREFRPNKWDAPAGGHHRKGVLTFPVGSLNPQTTGYVLLIIRDTAGVKERDLKWKLA